jgi:MtrB/PioB family decaheme-associated outer membrane protein
VLKQKPLGALFGLTLSLGSPALAWAQSDTSDTQRVGNTQFGNILDPTGWAPFATPDPTGMSYLHAGQQRTPTGSLYPYPSAAPNSAPLGHSDWIYSAYLELGYLHTSGERNDEFFQMYSDWKNGGAVGMLAFSAYNLKTGQYAELRGSRISDNDQYYRLRAGQYGDYRIEAFYRDIPHTLSTTAYPLWNGAGTTNLTLPNGLTPAGSTQAQVTAVEANRLRQTLQVNRQSEGLSWEGALTKNWIGYAGVTTEHRTGDRDWGGPMFFSYVFDSVGPGGPGTQSTPGMMGGQYETVRPVDFTTTDINFGLRNKGGASGWMFNFTGSGSFFRDHSSTLNYAVPFAVAPGETSAITGGTWSLEPDNNYYNIRVEASHPLKLWNGEFSASASYGSMRQNAPLQAPLSPMYCPSGQYVGTTTIACADWNTTAALSQQDGDARIDTGLINLRLSFRPTAKFNWYANLRWYDEDNMTRYTLYNPLTGQYGYVPENGSESVITGESELFQAGNPLYQSNFAQIAAIPYSYDDRKFELGDNYQINQDNSFGMNYVLDRQTPHPRERTYINDQHLKFNWDTKTFGDSTLRFSYEYEKRTGSSYDSSPYLNWYSPSLPGYVLTELGYVEFTVAQMYKYDMSNLKASKLKAIMTTPLGQTATLTTTLYGNDNHYGADIGRQSFNTTGADFSWDWSATATTSMSVYANIESTRLKQGNVNDNESLIDTSPEQQDTNFGSAMFPYANFWTATDTERDEGAGARMSHTFSARVKLDLNYDYTYSRGLNSYNYASLGAISAAYQPILTVADVGDSFPPNVYHMQTLTANLNVALTQQIGLRLYGEYEFGNYVAWNYTGFDTPADLVIGNRVFTDLGPAPRWHATVVGVFVTLKL